MKLNHTKLLAFNHLWPTKTVISYGNILESKTLSIISWRNEWKLSEAEWISLLSKEDSQDTKVLLKASLWLQYSSSWCLLNTAVGPTMLWMTYTVSMYKSQNSSVTDSHPFFLLCREVTCLRWQRVKVGYKPGPNSRAWILSQLKLPPSNTLLILYLIKLCEDKQQMTYKSVFGPCEWWRYQWASRRARFQTAPAASERTTQHVPLSLITWAHCSSLATVLLGKKKNFSQEKAQSFHQIAAVLPDATGNPFGHDKCSKVSCLPFHLSVFSSYFLNPLMYRVNREENGTNNGKLGVVEQPLNQNLGV